jgi:hypothetical protein
LSPSIQLSILICHYKRLLLQINKRTFYAQTQQLKHNS